MFFSKVGLNFLRLIDNGLAAVFHRRHGILKDDFLLRSTFGSLLSARMEKKSGLDSGAKCRNARSHFLTVKGEKQNACF